MKEPVQIHALQRRLPSNRHGRSDDTITLMPRKYTVDQYLEAYNSVGASVGWWIRNEYPREALKALLVREGVVCGDILLDGHEAGFFEFYRENPKLIRLLHFGLMPEYCGQRLSSPALLKVIDLAGAAFESASYIYLTTTSRDHPAAYHLYTKHGFQKINQWVEEWPLNPARMAPDPGANPAVIVH